MLGQKTVSHTGVYGLADAHDQVSVHGIDPSGDPHKDHLAHHHLPLAHGVADDAHHGHHLQAHHAQHHDEEQEEEEDGVHHQPVSHHHHHHHHALHQALDDQHPELAHLTASAHVVDDDGVSSESLGPLPPIAEVDPMKGSLARDPMSQLYPGMVPPAHPILAPMYTHLPLNPTTTMDEMPLYVNAKQYNRILKRRAARAKQEHDNMILPRKGYLHQSRHKWAKGRKRGPGGRFLSRGESLKDEEEEEDDNKNGLVGTGGENSLDVEEAVAEHHNNTATGLASDNTSTSTTGQDDDLSEAVLHDRKRLKTM